MDMSWNLRTWVDLTGLCTTMERACFAHAMLEKNYHDRVTLELAAKVMPDILLTLYNSLKYWPWEWNRPSIVLAKHSHCIGHFGALWSKGGMIYNLQDTQHIGVSYVGMAQMHAKSQKLPNSESLEL